MDKLLKQKLDAPPIPSLSKEALDNSRKHKLTGTIVCYDSRIMTGAMLHTQNNRQIWSAWCLISESEFVSIVDL